MIRRASLPIALLFLASMAVFAGEKDVDKKVERFHRKNFTVDSHTDTPLRMSQKDFDLAVRHNARTDHSKVDLPRMKDGGLDGAFFAVFVSQGVRTPEGYEKAARVAAELFDTLVASTGRNLQLAGIATSPEEAWNLKKQGKAAIFIGMENGYPIGLNLSSVGLWYDKGVRYITLVHTRNNDLCDSSTDTTAGYNGLSAFGEEVVKEMNRLGMMIDVSHASDSSFYDILAVSKAPVIASHSCARALCDNPRNLSDTMLTDLAKNGGVIQMCILSDYVKTPDPNPLRDSARAALRKKYKGFNDLSEEEMKKARKDWYALEDQYPSKLATVQDVCDHIDHIVKVAGIDHVGIGTDFDGGGGVEGCIDASEMKNITRELIRRGYSEKDLEKIWGGNLFRVMNDVQKVSLSLRKNS